MPVLAVDAFSKTYDKTVAVHGLSFELEAGQVRRRGADDAAEV